MPQITGERLDLMCDSKEGTCWVFSVVFLSSEGLLFIHLSFEEFALPKPVCRGHILVFFSVHALKIRIPCLSQKLSQVGGAELC